MASSLVPPPRLAADVLSLPDTKQSNEGILNGMLGANPTAGEQLADEAQAHRMASSHPTYTFGVCHNNRVKVIWNYTSINHFGHKLDEKTVAFEHDITTTGDANIVLIKEPDFAIRSAVAVYSPEEACTLYQADPTKKKLDPPPNTRSDKINLKYRKMFRIPHVGASTLMKYPDGITPSQYFREVYPTLDTPEKKEEWRIVTEQFQVLAMAQTPGGDESVAELLSPLELVRVDNVVSRFTNIGLYEVLPERRDGGTAKGLHNLNVSLSGGLGATVQLQEKQLQYQIAESERRQKEKESKKSLKSKLGESDTARLLRLMGLDTEEEIPQDSVFYLFRQSDGKSAECFRALLSDKVKDIARKMGKDKLAPQITLAMATALLRVQFYKEDLDDVCAGWLSSFLMYGSSPTEFTRKQIDLSKASESQGIKLKPEEAAALQKFKTYLPVTHKAHENVLRMLMVAMAILPPEHKFLAHLESMRAEWENNTDVIEKCVLNGTAYHKSKGILILEAFTIKINRFWKQLDQGTAHPVLEPPGDLFESMENRGHWVPLLTPYYTAKLGLKDFTGVINDFCLENMLEDGSAGVRGAAGGGGGADASTSGRGNPLPPPNNGDSTPADSGPPRVQETVKNAAYNDVLFGEFRRRKINNREITIRSFKAQAIATKPLPSSKFGAEYMCLAWHVKGMCNASCGQKEDHHSYSAAEYAPLVSWCQECYPAGE